MFGYSHEQVRQVIGHLNLMSPVELRRQQMAEKIANWLQQGLPPSATMHDVELSISSLVLLLNEGAGAQKDESISSTAAPTV